MTKDKKRWTSIYLSDQTKRRLDAHKHPGQSYDGLLQELMDTWEKEHPKEESSKPTE